MSSFSNNIFRSRSTALYGVCCAGAGSSRMSRLRPVALRWYLFFYFLILKIIRISPGKLEIHSALSALSSHRLLSLEQLCTASFPVANCPLHRSPLSCFCLRCQVFHRNIITNFIKIFTIIFVAMCLRALCGAAESSTQWTPLRAHRVALYSTSRRFQRKLQWGDVSKVCITV